MLRRKRREKKLKISVILWLILYSAILEENGEILLFIVYVPVIGEEVNAVTVKESNHCMWWVPVLI